MLPWGGALQREDERPQQRAARLPSCSALGAFHRTRTHGQDGGDAAAEARLAEAEERRGRPHACTFPKRTACAERKGRFKPVWYSDHQD